MTQSAGYEPKSPDWSEQDLERLVRTRATESLTLEFKRCAALGNTDAKKNELSKDVASFANSAGGMIIYGMVEHEHIASAIDEGFDPSEITKEWLEEVINSRIQRRISGIRIMQVQLTRHRPGRVAYVVEIPQSLNAPHQSWDKKFYRRFNFSSVPMEEYEIRDVATRASVPNLVVTYVTRPIGRNEESGRAGPWSRLRIDPGISNESNAVAEYASIRLYVDKHLFVEHNPLWQPKPDETAHFLVGEASYGCREHVLNWGVPAKMPLFRDVTFSLFDEYGLIVQPPGISRYLLGWRVFAPLMEPKSGFVLLNLAKDRCDLVPVEARLQYRMGQNW